MQRLTAKFLLLFALVGTFIPPALAVSAVPQHACCVRKTHHCHDSAGHESEQRNVGSAGCCNHDCCRAAMISQWAHPQPPSALVAAQNSGTRIFECHPDTPIAHRVPFKSTRAPPQIA